ncbi:MAG: PAS domain S-box protein [Pseudomonadales bacterium]
MKNNRIILLILVMAVIAVCVSGIAITMLYKTAMQQQAIRLAETAQSQARFLEAVARFDARFSAEDVPGGPFAATLQQIREAHELFKGFGETGEFTLGKREGNEMLYLLDTRSRNPATLEKPLSPLRLPLEGQRATAMQQALLGNAGTLIGLDYRGVEVLAAFEPVAELNLGIVAKIDLTEIRQPFVYAGIFVVLITLILVIIGTILVGRIGNPLIQKLEENDHRLRSILDTAADGIITLDEDGLIRSFNQAAEKIFGYSAEEAIGQHITTLVADPLPYFYHGNTDGEGVLKTDSEREVTGLHRSGKQVPLEIAVSEVQDRHTRIITSIVRDITERKEALQALRQREEELRLTFENTPAGIYICSLSGEILRANLAFCSLLGHSQQSLIGRVHTDFVNPDDKGRLAYHEGQLVNGNFDSYSLEISFVEREGNKIPCKFRSSVIRNEKGTPQLCIMHIEDLSEQLKNEQLVSEHRERLAQVTRLSTLGEMAASIAHEINQPLSAVATYATACQRLVDQEQPNLGEISQILNKISNQALRAGDVIHRLREFIRNRKTQKEKIACSDLISEVIGLAEVDAQYHHVTIQTDLEPDLPLIYVDAVQIQQVILNLLRNAIESMDKVSNPLNKVVRLEVRRRGTDTVEVSVIDRGEGIPAASVDQLFTPFFTSKPMGMGLGLPISRSIVNAHEGQLYYTHNAEGGSIFRFTLPL